MEKCFGACLSRRNSGDDQGTPEVPQRPPRRPRAPPMAAPRAALPVSWVRRLDSLFAILYDAGAY
jgi:hypothetical protein